AEKRDTLENRRLAQVVELLRGIACGFHWNARLFHRRHRWRVRHFAAFEFCARLDPRSTACSGDQISSPSVARKLVHRSFQAAAVRNVLSDRFALSGQRCRGGDRETKAT